MSIDIGNTESKLCEYLLYLYKDSSLLSNKKMPFDAGFLNEAPEDSKTFKHRSEKFLSSLNPKKSLL